MTQKASDPKTKRSRRKKRRKISWTAFAGGLLAVLFALYLGYQLIGNMGRSIRTQEALVTEVEETVDAAGIFLRDQILISGSGGSSARYLVDNGERVAKGQQVAVFFDSETAAQDFQTCQELEYQLEALEKSLASLTSGMDTLQMDSMIYDTLQQLSGELDKGQTATVSQLYASLNQLIITRGSGDGGSEALKTQIAQVQTELKQAKSKLSSSKTINAPQAGYFIKSADGYETEFTVAALDSLTAEDIKTATPAAAGGNVIGSLMQEFAWYYAAVVDHDTAEALRNRTAVSVRFPQISDQRITVTVEQIRTEDHEAVVVLKSTDMSAQYLSARTQEIQIVLNTYTGIRVPRAALRQLEGQWGVYCLDGSVAAFKPVEWIYQTEEYYLVPSAARPAEGLYQYDKMILGAKNLADGQVMK